MKNDKCLIVRTPEDDWDTLDTVWVELHPSADPDDDEPKFDSALEEFSLTNPRDLRRLADLIEKSPSLIITQDEFE